MRTLATQVKLRRLLRSFGEAADRIGAEPVDPRTAAALADRLEDLAEDVRQAWRRESLVRPPQAALEGYVQDQLRTVELAIAGLRQQGADVELLRQDFEGAALPLEVFMRGLDVEPALQRSA